MLPWRFASFDLLETDLLSSEDVTAVVEAAKIHGKSAILRGDVDTSLEPPETRLYYRLMDGIQIAELIPALNALYSGPLVELVSRIFDVPLCASPVVQNGINLNIIEGSRSRYEWHLDSNPITGLLVFTESDERTGGRLLFGKETQSQIALSLKAGQFLAFDARRAPHAVEPLRVDLTRVTAPMNFFIAGAPVDRPTGLDEALYGSN